MVLTLFLHVQNGGEYQGDDEADEDVGCKYNDSGELCHAIEEDGKESDDESYAFCCQVNSRERTRIMVPEIADEKYLPHREREEQNGDADESAGDDYGLRVRQACLRIEQQRAEQHENQCQCQYSLDLHREAELC